MCTLTYMPTGGNQYILTSNRDESPKRKAAVFPHTIQISGIKLLFPKDEEKGGTWIAASSRETVICLLNGAFEPHDYNPPYRKSRGLVLLDVFGFASAEEFATEYDLKGVEPFTMICIENGNEGNKVTELRWDGTTLHKDLKNTGEPLLWASASLYSPEAQRARERFFHRWLNKVPQFNQANLVALHQSMKMGRFENDFKQDGTKPPVETLSITGVVKDNARLTMNYHDLISNTPRQSYLNLSKND